MGLLHDLFGMDTETEKDIKNIIKVVGIVAVILSGASAADSLNLPFFDDGEE